MNKNKLALSALLLSLISASAGYVAGRKEQASSPDKKQGPGQTAPSAIVPRPPLPPLADKTPWPDIRNRELGDLFALYERMTPEQLDREIYRWENIISRKNTMDFNGGLTKKEQLALAFLSYKWGKTAPRQAMERLKNMGELSRIMAPRIIQGWAEVNPGEASTFLMEHRADMNNYSYSGLLRNTAWAMAHTSPEIALKWGMELRDEERHDALPTIIGQLAAAHPDQIQKYADRLAPEDLQNYALSCELSRQWAAHDWEAATRWMENTLSGDVKETAFRSALQSLCAADPEKALAEFNKLEKKTEGRFASLANTLAETDPVAALQWLAENAPEQIAVKRTCGIVDSGHATPRLTEYALNMEASPVRDAMLKDLAERELYRGGGTIVNFAQRLSLADHIGDPAKKEASVNKILDDWLMQEPQKAKTWIETSGLPEKIKRERLQK